MGPGDWQEKNPDALPGGWVFEFRNDFYPDVDDTAFVLMALQRVEHPEPARLREAARRGIDWLVSMQNRDGGWGGFDKDNDRQFLNQIPFADHNAMLDPSSADVTARVHRVSGHATAGRSAIRYISALWRIWRRNRLRKGRGTGAGASTTSTGPAACCGRWRR